MFSKQVSGKISIYIHIILFVPIFLLAFYIYKDVTSLSNQESILKNDRYIEELKFLQETVSLLEQNKIDLLSQLKDRESCIEQLRESLVYSATAENINIENSNIMAIKTGSDGQPVDEFIITDKAASQYSDHLKSSLVYCTKDVEKARQELHKFVAVNPRAEKPAYLLSAQNALENVIIHLNTKSLVDGYNKVVKNLIEKINELQTENKNLKNSLELNTVINPGNSNTSSNKQAKVDEDSVKMLKRDKSSAESQLYKSELKSKQQKTQILTLESKLRVLEEEHLSLKNKYISLDNTHQQCSDARALLNEQLKIYKKKSQWLLIKYIEVINQNKKR